MQKFVTFDLNIKERIMAKEGYNVDNIDRKILSHLVRNARTAFLEIARECGISGAAIHQRIKKMEEAEIIIGSQFLVKPSALGYGVCAFIGVELEQANMYSSVIEQVKKISEVVECHFVTGDYFVLLKVYCRDNDHLLKIITDSVQNIPGVSRTNTFISLDQSFERQVYVKEKALIAKRVKKDSAKAK